ncbi:MAG: sulfite exporter TauE/SafE family protein [Desulfitobacteriia bacterium]|jgi:uncharacterized membrane protein YfcA
MAVLFFVPVGALVGTLSGFFGIGGGIVLTPLLLLLGFEPVVAVATSLMFTLGTSMSGAITHTRMNNVDWKTAALVGIAGAVLAQISRGIVFYISGRHNWFLNICLIFMLFYFAYSLYKGNNGRGTKAVFKSKYLAAPFIGCIAGFLAALLGIGGGFIIAPLLIKWLGFDSKKAIGTSLACIIIISCGALIGYGFTLKLNYALGLCLIIGAFIGSPFGARMTSLYAAEEIGKKLGILYFFSMTSIALDLLATFTAPILGWMGLGVLITFMIYMFFDFYQHRTFTKKS